MATTTYQTPSAQTDRTTRNIGTTWAWILVAALVTAFILAFTAMNSQTGTETAPTAPAIENTTPTTPNEVPQPTGP